MKYLNSSQRNTILKVQNSLLELEKKFKPIKVSADDMDKFEEKDITKTRTAAKSAW